MKSKNKINREIYSWIERLNVVKISVLPNLINRFSAIPGSYFVVIDKQVLKFSERERPNITSSVLKEKNKVG